MTESATEPIGIGSQQQRESIDPDAPVPAPKSKAEAAYQTAAFALSALLSPYLVIPIGTVGIVATQHLERARFFHDTEISILFSTVIPALYVLLQIGRGKISDVHVMDREQRGGPLLVAVVTSGMGACLLRMTHAPVPVWAIGVVVSVNGLVFLAITAYWKISIHVAVLSSAVIAAVILIPDAANMGTWKLLFLIPAIIWARVARRRHTLWQGITAFVVASCITGLVLLLIYRVAPATGF